MRAVVQTADGGPEVLALRDVATPAPGPNQVRIRVHATALNRADVLQRRGRYPAPPGWPADIPGLEYAGEVEAVDASATRWKTGARVMGLVGGGAHAEYVVVHEDEALPVPSNLPFEHAAAIPEAFLTAFDALTTRGRLQAGERLLIHAAGSGVGTAAIQLGRNFGATVLGTSRSAAKLERAGPLGLDVGIHTAQRSFRDQVGEPVQLIVDVLGAPSFGDNLSVLAPLGRLVLLGFLGGSRGDLDLEPVLRKRVHVIGTVMRTRSLEERIELVESARVGLLPLLESGAVTPIVDRVLPMREVADAHRAMERGETFGKIVLQW